MDTATGRNVDLPLETIREITEGFKLVADRFRFEMDTRYQR
jgi:hypothetical protein